MSTNGKRKNGTKPKKAERPLTGRDKKLLKILQDDPEIDVKEAMIQAGFAESTASKQSKRTVEKSSFQEAMEKTGITDAYLTKKLQEGLEADKIISAVSGKDAGTESMDFVEVPDHAARKSYLDMAHKIKGAYAPTKTHTEHSGSVTHKLDREGVESFMDFLRGED
jgi:hypothetical protein